jgi:hypothetical protein
MKPKRLKLRMYQVGFGDSFLLTFTYAQGNKHVLIDCGSNAKHGYDIDDVAADILDVCKTEPVAIVATHRHKDHIAGFGGKAWKSLKKLKVKRVIQPWTEHPDLDPDATAPSAVGTAAVKTVAKLSSLQALAAKIAELAPDLIRDVALRERVLGVAANNMKNPELVKNLASFKNITDYVECGTKGVLKTFLPGVKVHVLGPPTRDEASFSYAGDSDEYWSLVGGRSDRAESQRVKGGPPLDLYDEPPIHAKWLKARLDKLREQRWLEIVTAVDSALNNTSVILVFEIGKHVLLFPGDAQLENWRFALAQHGVKDLLAKVTWYKVGHHGSHNATPKSMWTALAKRGNGLSTLLSTHHHGSYPDVPQHHLVEALDGESHLYSTEHEDNLVVEIDELVF